MERIIGRYVLRNERRGDLHWEQLIWFLGRFQLRVVFPMRRSFRGGEEEAHEQFAAILTQLGFTLDERLP